MAQTQTDVRSRIERDNDLNDASPNRIQADIDRTRAEMDQTIDELGDRLQPRYLMDAIMDQVKMSGRDMASCAKDAAKDTGQALWQSIKNNPMPLALIGSGVAWLIVNQRRSSSSSGGRMYGGSYVDARTGQPYDESYGAEFTAEVSELSEEFGEYGEESADIVGAMGGACGLRGEEGSTIGQEEHSGTRGQSFGQKASDIGGKVKEKAKDLGEKGKDMLQSAKDRLSQAAHRMRGEGGGHMGERLRETTDKAKQQFSHGRDVAGRTLQDNPLAIGGLAVGLGLLIGMVLPRTRREDQIMGETADELKHRAKERARHMGEEAIERSGHVVSSGVECATDTAQREFSAEQSSPQSSQEQMEQGKGI